MKPQYKSAAAKKYIARKKKSGGRTARKYNKKPVYKKRVSLFDKARPRIEGHAAGGSISAFIAPHRQMPSYMKTIYKAANKGYWSQAQSRSVQSQEGLQGCFALQLPLSCQDTFANAMLLASSAQTTPWQYTQRVLFVKTMTTHLIRKVRVLCVNN